MIPDLTTPTKPAKTSFSFQKLALNVGALLLCSGAAFLYAQAQGKQKKIELLKTMLEQSQVQTQASAQLAPQDVVSRTETVDLQSVAAVGAQPTPPANVILGAQAATPRITPAPESQTAFLTPVTQQPEAVTQPASLTDAAPSDDAGRLITDALEQTPTNDDVIASVEPLQTTTLPSTLTVDSDLAERARRMETLAIIDAGVQELVAAVVAGQYDIHTYYESAEFSGRIHFAFVGHEADQTALELFLANAAEEGIIAHSSAVVGSDGKVNGHVMLFDLVERALENGTPEEQRAGERMRQEAIALLAKDDTVGETVVTTDTDGERVYVVEAGDSLAYIALQFYGNTNDYTKIYNANRNVLSNPQQIRVGQRLKIPKA